MEASFECKINNINEYRIDTDDLYEYYVEEIVILEENQFSHFCNNLSDDYEFLQNIGGFLNRECTKRAVVCISSNKSQFKILVDTQGYDYARYVAKIPNI